MIHVSDILHYQQCPKLAWNHRFHKLQTESFYHMEIPYIELYTRLLGIDAYASGKTGDSNEKTLSMLENNQYVLNARLEYKGCRTRIPVFVKGEDGYTIIYPFLSSYPKEFESKKMKMNQIICEKNGIHIVDTKIIYLNKDYIRKDALVIEECLLMGNMFFNKRNNPSKNVQEAINETEIDLDSLIDEVDSLFNGEEPVMKRNKKCTTGRRCKFYEHCFDDSLEPDNSILFFTTSQHKLKEYDNGIKHIHEIDINHIEGFRLQYAQYLASMNGQFIDYAALIPWMDEIQYPISYLDFEWDTFAIPPYSNMKPFDVLCFQYSLHVEEKEEELKHMDFFGSGDCREAFIQSLISNVPKEGSILVYNMEGAEKLRLVQLGEQFPEYKEELDSICARMIDLSKPFEIGVFYDNRMRGHYSLKNILPIFSDEFSYKTLEIQNGMNAVYAYRNFEKSNESKRNEIIENISTYCAMDTFAEYIVYHGLLKCIKESQYA